eukprot:Tbor_TRINITY_DN5392_c0_g1::TRINITY_DN5392_c0_g1_i1::g.4002::m.4002
MKVVYIPVVLPIIKRTLFSIVLLILSAVLITIGLSLGRWIFVTYKRVEAPAEYIPDGSIMTMYVQQGLQNVELRTCYHVVDFVEPMCLSRSIIYSFCKTKEGYCAGKLKFTVSFACFIIVIVGCVISIIVALMNEKAAGFVALFAYLVFGTAGILTFVNGQIDIQNREFVQLNDNMASMKKTLETDVSFHLCVVGVCFGALAGFICSTIICCPSKSYTERERAHIQVVTMEVGGATSIAANAPRVGFMRIGESESGSEFQNVFSIGHGDEEDDIELDLITSTNEINKQKYPDPGVEQESPQVSALVTEGDIPHSSSNRVLLSRSTDNDMIHSSQISGADQSHSSPASPDAPVTKWHRD